MKLSHRNRQLAFVLQSIPGRRRPGHLLRAPLDFWKTLRQMKTLQRTLSEPPLTPSPGLPPCSAVLLSHNRPYNMQVIVDAALKSGVVTELVVSNSNRNIDIQDWIHTADPRVTLINDLTPTRPGHRFTLAKNAKSDHFLAIDDDFFLTPSQWASFFGRLVENPNIPHCLRGNDYIPGKISSNGSPFHHIQGVTKETDVLIGSYAFQREHIDRMILLSRELGFGNISQMAPIEDVVMSFAGKGRPHVHNLGEIIMCASESLEGIALWKTHTGFWQERIDAYEKTSLIAKQLFPEWWT